MDEDWASTFRPGVEEPIVPEPQESGGSVDVSVEKIMRGFEAIVKRLDSLDARLSLFEASQNSPVWLPELYNALQALSHGNVEALIRANQQFSSLVIRKIDEMEERIKSDEPSYTNVLYSDPELFDEISARADGLTEESEEDDAVLEAKPDLPNPIDGDILYTAIPEEVRREYGSWKDPEGDGTWQSFVRVCGGPVKAKHYRALIES
jgi:hypothetical protein